MRKTDFLSAWAAGYLAGGGDLTDDAEAKLVTDYRRHDHAREQPLPLPLERRFLAALYQRRPDPDKPPGRNDMPTSEMSPSG